MARILVVDDEEPILELIKFNLEKENFEVFPLNHGGQALKICSELQPDLVILDIMLPGMDGLEICRTIRQMPNLSEVPVIMLTARGDELDKVLGLEMGADDYMTKPFSPRELVARVKARLRRHKTPAASVVAAGDILIDPERFQVTVRGESLDLTPKELELLKLLVANKGKVVSRDYLLERVWGYDYIGDTRTVDVHVRHLRQKIEDDPANPLLIETVRGVGYRFKQK